MYTEIVLLQPFEFMFENLSRKTTISFGHCVLLYTCSPDRIFFNMPFEMCIYIIGLEIAWVLHDKITLEKLSYRCGGHVWQTESSSAKLRLCSYFLSFHFFLFYSFCCLLDMPWNLVIQKRILSSSKKYFLDKHNVIFI